jgi:flagellar motor switch protein FliN/FliY
MRIEEHVLWSPLSRMTVATAAGIPLSGFKIGDLLRLAPGQIVESKWSHTEDIPLKAGRVQVAWTEFEVVDQHLMVRLTRLA